MAAGQADERLLAQLRDRVGQRVTGWRPGARVLGVSPLTGGTSSLTFLVDLAGVAAAETPVVLKVAPPGLAPVRNRDVLRQARLQQAVQGAGRPLAPDVLFSDPGDRPEVPPFMAMNLVPGDCVEPVLTDAAERPGPAQVRLGGEPVVGLADEVDRWTRAFVTLPSDMAGDYQRAAKALRASIPKALPPAVNHGDFRLGNTLCEGNRINAVIDWEIWSVGDPRIDLAWLTFFTDDAGHPAVAPGTVAGTPSGREIVRAYEDARRRPVPDLGWFDALTRYKEAGVTGLLLKRATKLGRPVKESMARMQPELPRLVQEAIRIVSG